MAMFIEFHSNKYQRQFRVGRAMSAWTQKHGPLGVAHVAFLVFVVPCALADDSIRNLYQRRLDQKLVEFRFDENINSTYEHIRESMMQAGLEALGEVRKSEDKNYKWDFNEDT
ncbi:unnamed protein product, partial [Callosobruchus maculatus]